MNTTFSDNLKNLRQKLSLSQREFAERAEITPSTMSAYEKGTKKPTLDTLIKISQEFNISLDELCGIEREIKTELNISNIIDLIYSLVIENKIYPHQESDCNGNIVSDYGLFTNNKLLYNFFVELAEMNTLYKNNTIKKSLFDLWIEDKKREYTEKEEEREINELLGEWPEE